MIPCTPLQTLNQKFHSPHTQDLPETLQEDSSDTWLDILCGFFLNFDPTSGQFPFQISNAFFGMKEASESSEKVTRSPQFGVKLSPETIGSGHFRPTSGLEPIRRLRKPTSGFKIKSDSSFDWLSNEPYHDFRSLPVRD